MPADISHVLVQRTEHEDELCVIGGTLFVEAAIFIDVPGDIFFDSLAVAVGDLAAAARETEDVPLAAESIQFIAGELLDVVAGRLVDIAELLCGFLENIGISLLCREQGAVIRYQLLLFICQAVISLARGGDIVPAAFCDGADGVDEVNDIVRGIFSAVAEPGVVIGIEHLDAVAVGDEVLIHRDARDTAVDRVHPA